MVAITVCVYFPAAHAVHIPPSSPVYPILQRQLVIAVDPATDWEFAGQLLQLFSPLTAYVPALQVVHSLRVCEIDENLIALLS